MGPANQPIRRRVPFPRRRLDSRGVQIVRRLQAAGHETYFVGGCVRDLLLDQRPKDFDIATSARPRAVRSAFSRARVIGRRFRIVHVHSGRQVFEVSTFRKAPPAALAEEARIIREDNIFGTAREDAQRRDFTVNALFLDPQSGEIVDWVGGLEDIRRKRLRAIGDPHRRFSEDPVRVLRLIKFMRRLHLQPGDEEVAAARESAHLVRQSAPPRVVEEMFRLMQTGDMVGVLADLEALQLLPLVLPDLAAWMRRREGARERLQARLGALDAWLGEGGDPSYGLRLALLYGPLIEDELDPATRSIGVRDPAQVPAAVLARLQERARLPRIVLSRAARIVLAQRRLDPPPGVRGRRWDPARLLEHETFPEALEYLRCRLEAEGREPELYDEWQERLLAARADADDPED